MKIGLDFDGVFSNCGKLLSEEARRTYGVDISPSKFKKEIVVGKGHLTAEQYRELQKIVYGTPEVGLLMSPVDDVLRYVPQLLSEGHTILIVTSRSGEGLEIAEKWSVNYGLSLDFIGVGHGKSKAGAAAGLDLFVDDDLDKLEQLVGIVPNRFLFSWGYNEHIEVGSIAKRVSSWKSLYCAIQALGRSY